MNANCKIKPVAFVSMMILIFSLISVTSIYAQTEELLINTEELLLKDEGQSVSEISDAVEDLTEKLEYLKKNPVDINTNSPVDLLNIPYLSIVQVNYLHNYLLEYGPFISIYELEAVPGFDEDLIERILPFVKISSFRPDLRRHRIRNELLFVVKEKPSENTIDSVQISQFDRNLELKSRYFLSINDKMFLRINTLKSNGSTLMSGREISGVKCASINAELKNIGILETLVAGDYKLNFGQGLTMSSGSGFFSSAGDIRKKGGAVRPVTGFSGIGTMKGAAGSIHSGKFDFTGFFSICRNDTIKEDCTGAHLIYKSERFNLGFTSFKVIDNNPAREHYEPYQIYNNKGREYSATGFDFLLIRNSMAVFGEFSYPSGNDPAGLLGLQFEPLPLLGINIIARYYPIDYYNPYSGAYSKNTRNQQETGLLLEMHVKPKPRTDVSVSMDLVRFPWYKYQIDAPSSAAYFRLCFGYNFTKQSNLSIVSVYNHLQNSATLMTKINSLSSCEHQTFSMRFSQMLTDNFSVTTRANFCTNLTGKSLANHGYLMAQDFRYKIPVISGRFILRYALFQTDTYNERLYIYEDNLEGSFSMPSYYGQGSRVYCIFSFKLRRLGELNFKYNLSKSTGEQELNIALKFSI